MLDKNFRSRACVTGAVNYLFGLLMSRGMGGLDYDEAESLKRRVLPGLRAAKPEFRCFPRWGTRRNDRSRRRGKADLRPAGSGYKLPTAEPSRAVQPRDICILMRSPPGAGAGLCPGSGQCGRGAVGFGRFGLSHLREVAGAVGMLRALLNPLWIRSCWPPCPPPLFDFTDDDAASIRLRLRSGPFYLAC